MKHALEPIPLTLEEFLPFGFYANMLETDATKLGEPPIEFFRDLVQQDLGTCSTVSYSNCRIEPRAPIIDNLECHSKTAECMLPLDNDILLQVAPATPSGTGPELDRITVFQVPCGTMVVMRPGTWHHGPFALNERPTNILVALPERTYANDTTTVEIEDADRPKIHTE